VTDKPKIAVIGAGITGLSAAWLLRDAFDVTLYEAAARAGGHADTQNVRIADGDIAVDTGFIVFNDVNYPNLVGLFDALGVASHASNMSFGVSKNNAAFEYAGGELAQLFAQPSNVLRPRFWAMVRDILRFNREAPAVLATASTQSLGAYLIEHRYSTGFVEDYVLPMGAAIWSASVEGMKAFPARSFIRFFVNHGLLKVVGRPQWRTVTGGSQMYVQRILRDLADVRVGAAVTRIESRGTNVAVTAGGETVSYDQVICCAHADQTLSMLASPSSATQAVLGAIKFQDNEAVLHQDIRLMPRRKRAWSAWNYLSEGRPDHGQAVCLTYWMNLLQGLITTQPLLVSLNPNLPIDPARVLMRKTYRHPQFDAAAIAAQAALPAIQGVDRIWYAGAWTGWGFHEDGIAAALRVANSLGVQAQWQP